MRSHCWQPSKVDRVRLPQNPLSYQNRNHLKPSFQTVPWKAPFPAGRQCRTCKEATVSDIRGWARWKFLYLLRKGSLNEFLSFSETWPPDVSSNLSGFQMHMSSFPSDLIPTSPHLLGFSVNHRTGTPRERTMYSPTSPSTSSCSAPTPLQLSHRNRSKCFCCGLWFVAVLMLLKTGVSPRHWSMCLHRWPGSGKPKVCLLSLGIEE